VPEASTPSEQTIIDVIVLVFARSQLRDLVGTDALRTVLAGSTRELFPESRQLALQPVWELLESQAGFDRDQATPPMCRLKLLEDKLAITVILPVVLQVLDRETIETQARECRIDGHDLEKVVSPPRATTSPPLARAIETVSIPQRAVAAESSRQKLAIIACVIGLGAAGMSAYFTFGESGSSGGGNSIKIPPAEITTEIPLREIVLSDGAMLGVLADGEWANKSEFDRRRVLEAAAPAVRARGGISLTVVDPKGLPVATLILQGTPKVVFVPLPAVPR